MCDFTYESLTQRVVFGNGAARTQLAAEIARLDAARVMVVSTRDNRELMEPLADRVAGVFSAVRAHVPVEVATEAETFARDCRADVVLCIGGGSTTGVAKAIARRTGLPIIAVPTTYAGSEATPTWGLTEDGRKTTGVDPAVLPRTVIYDPKLTVSLPVEMSAASGMNAMAHCVEAFWAPGRNPISSLAAEEGIRALTTGLPAVVRDGRDLDARADLLYAAYLAGSAFAVAGSGLHHKICHVLGGAYDLPHAETHAVLLPHVLAFIAPGAPDAVRRIGRAMGADDPVAALRDLAAGLGIPPGLRDLGLRADQLDEAARLASRAAPTDNPVPVDRATIRTLLRAAWSAPS